MSTRFAGATPGRDTYSRKQILNGGKDNTRVNHWMFRSPAYQNGVFLSMPKIPCYRSDAAQQAHTRESIKIYSTASRNSPSPSRRVPSLRTEACTTRNKTAHWTVAVTDVEVIARATDEASLPDRVLLEGRRFALRGKSPSSSYRTPTLGWFR